MADETYRRRVPKPAPETKRKRRNHKGIPQMMVELSAMPEFGGRACSLTMAYKFCYGKVVSARLAVVKHEAERILAEAAKEAKEERRRQRALKTGVAA